MNANGPLLEKGEVDIRWLGRVAFQEAFDLQEALVKERASAVGQSPTPTAPSFPSVLLLLEHEPVYTIGRTQDQTSLRGSEHLPYPVVQINRGGQATYHGPGQLVGYPILDLRSRNQDLHQYMRDLESVIIDALQFFGLDAIRQEGLTGVWVGGRKIASIGVGVRRWISMHGFALNVCGDLKPFSEITPCGISGVEMTNLEQELGSPITVKTVADCIAQKFLQRFF